MTRVLLLAALALACAVSPAFAANAIAGHIQGGSGETLFGLTVGTGLIMLSVIAGGCAVIWSGRPRIRDAAAVIAGLSMFLVMPGALAAEVATVGDKPVLIPWGDWLVALAVSLREPILTILLPIIAAYIIQAIRKVYPWAALFLSQRRVEMMLEAAVGYGMNAVNGAAKGKTLSVNVAVPVIAKGTQYVIDTAPPAVIKAAGGADGIAARIFRKLDLDDHASEAAVLVPAQEQIAAGTVDADELRRMDEMTRR